MPKLKAIAGYAWAALALPVVLATFIGMPAFSEAFVKATGLRVSPKYVAGDAVGSPILHDGGLWSTVVRKPEFPALIGESAEGYVQVEWLNDEKSKQDLVPAVIEEEIDYTLDGQPDFGVKVDTARRQATVTPHTPLVIGRPEVYHFHRGWAVRVWVRNPGR